jgi:hypothetical protein
MNNEQQNGVELGTQQPLQLCRLIAFNKPTNSASQTIERFIVLITKTQHVFT